MTNTKDVLFERRGVAGIITLNRPQALNALTNEMCLAMYGELKNWAQDDDVSMVIIQGAGEKAFCAGGDIRALYEFGLAKSPEAVKFYRDEYRLNTLIQEYPKPYIALIDGIVMGGGVGVSIHGSHRVAGDRTLFAMPESGIGLFPDVGGTYFLPRLQGELGLYLGLTGARLKESDALYAGIASHYVPSDQHQALIDDLSDGRNISETLADLSTDPGPAPIAPFQQAIDDVFSASSVRTILSRLNEEDGDWAKKTADIIRSKSPTSIAVTFRQIREGAGLDFRAAMALEFRLTNRFIEGVDFYEGVRAVVIDKDQSPKWQPDRLEDVRAQDVDAYFASLGDRELTFE